MVATSRPGFSIIELIVVMTIIAILTAGVFGAFKWVSKARIESTHNKLMSIKQGIELYQAQVGEYPQSLNDLMTKPLSNPAAAKRWRGPYGVETEADLNDVWGNALQYQRRPKGYALYSWGPSGEGSPEQEWITV